MHGLVCTCRAGQSYKQCRCSRRNVRRKFWITWGVGSPSHAPAAQSFSTVGWVEAQSVSSSSSQQDRDAAGMLATAVLCVMNSADRCASRCASRYSCRISVCLYPENSPSAIVWRLDVWRACSSDDQSSILPGTVRRNLPWALTALRNDPERRNATRVPNFFFSACFRMQPRIFSETSPGKHGLSR